MNIIPQTMVGAFRRGQCTAGSAHLGVVRVRAHAIGGIGRQLDCRALIEVVSRALFAVVGMVMWAAPMGAFGAIAFTVGKFGAGSLLSLGKLLGGFYLTCLVFVFGVLGPVCAGRDSVC
jgi:aerobic C4-dicarboxylate transport protein